MSEKESKSVSILLPPSKVAVFSADAKTREAVTKAEKDWRFARVEIEAYEGSIEAAISKYKNEDVPDLLIMQVAKIEDNLTAQLEDLSEYCNEDTAAIIIGPVNDVDLYRDLKDMGVSDYLVAPIKAPAIADVISQTLTEQMGIADSKMLVFIGAKGGVGTSSLAQAAALGASQLLKQKTILIDGSGGWSTHAVGMGFEPSTTLAQAAKAAEADDDQSLERMLIKVNDNLSVLGSGGDIMLEPAITPEQMETLIDKLKVTYPLVVADLSATASHVQKNMLMQASRIVLITSPFLACLRQARALIQEIKTVRDDAEKEIDLIVNMLGLDPKNEVSAKDMEKALEIKPDTGIKFSSETFLKSEAEGKKITDTEQGLAMIKQNIAPILHKVLGTKPAANSLDGDAAGSGLLDGFMKKLKK